MEGCFFDLLICIYDLFYFFTASILIPTNRWNPYCCILPASERYPLHSKPQSNEPCSEVNKRAIDLQVHYLNFDRFRGAVYLFLHTKLIGGQYWAKYLGVVSRVYVGYFGPASPIFGFFFVYI